MTKERALFLIGAIKGFFGKTPSWAVTSSILQPDFLDWLDRNDARGAELYRQFILSGEDLATYFSSRQ